MKMTAFWIIYVSLLIHPCLTELDNSLKDKYGEKVKGGRPLKSRRLLQETECTDYDTTDGCAYKYYCNTYDNSCKAKRYFCDDYSSSDGCSMDHYCDSNDGDYFGTCVSSYPSNPNPSAPTPFSAPAFVPYGVGPLSSPYRSPSPTPYVYTPSSPVYTSSSKAPVSIGVYVGAAIAGIFLLSSIILGAIFFHRRRMRSRAAPLETLTSIVPEYTHEGPPEPSHDIMRDIMEIKMEGNPSEQQIPVYTAENSDIERGALESPHFDGVTDASAYAGHPGWQQEEGEHQERDFTPVFETQTAPTAPSGQPPPPDTPSLPAMTHAMAHAMAPDDQLHFPSSPINSETASIDFGQWSINFQDLQMIKPIGSGSFGRVYLAMWHESPVAVKVLLDIGMDASGSALSRPDSEPAGSMPAALASPLSPSSLMTRLKQEASIMASLRHPNIVSFLGVCTSPACILSEYCARGSLYDVLKEAKQDTTKAAELTWERRIAMALDAAQGMCHLHRRSQPIVHRDLKSPNLLVDERWTVKVADFNLSRLLTSEARSMTVATNPRWLPPEILSGGFAGPAGDVFAFGVVLHEFITWELPWNEVNPFVIVGAVQRGQRPAFPDDAPGPDVLPSMDRYRALIEKCWAQDPAQRPTFVDIVRELRAQLEALRGNEAALNALKASPKERLAPAAPRWRF